MELHRRPERVRACGHCSPTFSVDHVFEWTHRGRPAQMHPNYDDELARLRSGRSAQRFSPGCRVRIIAPGRFRGEVGTVLARGRTRYRVRLRTGVVTVVFAGVEGA